MTCSSRSRALALALVLGAAAAPSSALAQGQSPAEIEQLKSTVSALEKTIQEMKRKIQDLEARQAAAPAPAPAQPPATAAAPTTPVPSSGTTVSTAPPLAEKPKPPSELSDRESTMRHRDTVAGDNIGAPRPGNAPMDPTYAGFFPLFGTSTWLKLGGYAKVDAIFDSDRIGNPNKFATGSIPVEGESNFGKEEEFTLHAKQTRVNLELRSPTSLGSLRIFYENDFFGDSSSPDMTYNLRHFYGQVANVTVGQTWSTFYDPDAIPDTLDLAGPGMQSALRQPQVRYTFSPGVENQHISVAIEEPKSDVGVLPGGATTRNVMPDFTANWRLESSRGHVQVGGLARTLAYENGPVDDSAFGWGANLSGVLHTWGQDGIVGRVTYGDGVGRYVQDFSSGTSTIVLPDGSLDTLTAWGALLGYRHFWSEHWRSEVTYGYLESDHRSEQGDKAYDHTHYAQANLVWAATKHFYVGLEYLYGFKATRDGSDGDDHRVQLSLQYHLIR